MTEHTVKVGVPVEVGQWDAPPIERHARTRAGLFTGRGPGSADPLLRWLDQFAGEQREHHSVDALAIGMRKFGADDAEPAFSASRCDAMLSRSVDQVRNNTFHFPSPKIGYTPSSDEQLRNALAGMRDRPCEMHLDHRIERPVITRAFAGDVALALALGPMRRSPPSGST